MGSFGLGLQGDSSAGRDIFKVKIVNRV